MFFQNKFYIVVFCLFMQFFKAHAFDIEKVKNEISIQLSQGLKANSKNNPVLILIGGYPGAGKTTLINALRQTYDMDVISWNFIRQALLDRNLKGSSYDWEIIEAVNENLFRLCLQRNTNIVIDINAYANNIKLFENLLKAEGYENQYHVIKICLNPPSEILLNRVQARYQQENVHQGTEADLLRDLNSSHKKINMNDYSLIIKNDEFIDFETELNIVAAFLKPYFNKQKN
ncbi:MAG TPA: AAA family ATPase [Parachlamydiaceae bacterium]|nr:AAA family ATPase [Parachlamydiaceae bacterium]